MISISLCDIHNVNLVIPSKQVLSRLDSKERKADRLRQKMKVMKNWKFMEFIDIDKLGYEEIVVVLQDVMKDKKAGSSTRTKIKKLLKYLSDDDYKFKKSYPRIDEQRNLIN